MISGSGAQERTGYCEDCGRKRLLRRQKQFLGWQPWRCTRCGTVTKPDRDPMPTYRKILLTVALAVVLLIVVAAAIATH